MSSTLLTNRRGLVPVGIAAVLFGLFTPAALVAQTAPPASAESRAGLLEAAREEAVAQVSPPTRSRLEKWLSWYDEKDLLERVLSPSIGPFHIASGGFPAGAGMTAAIGYDQTLPPRSGTRNLPNRVDLSALGAYSRQGYTRVSGSIALRDVAGSGVDISGFGQHYEYPQEDFFGFGIDSSESSRTNYLLEAAEAGGAVRWHPAKLDFNAQAAFFRPRVGAGTDTRHPSVEELFDPSTVPGLDSETDFLKLEGTAAFDWRDNPGLPRTGGRYAISVARFDDRDLGQFDTTRIGVALQQYIPLASRYRRLALRGEAIFTDADGDQSVPVYLQPTLGGAQNLRGYREFRFRDRNALLAGAEYQWEAWWALDVAFFVDAGTVAPTRSRLKLDDVEVTYGVGFRFHSNRALAGRLDLAFSREGFIPLLRFDHVF